MNILHISSTDVAGGRFNGYAMLEESYADYQFEMAVWQKTSNHPKVHQMRQGWLWFLNAVTARASNALAMQGWINPASFTLPYQPYFRRADLVHLQVIHNGFFLVWRRYPN